MTRATRQTASELSRLAEDFQMGLRISDQKTDSTGMDNKMSNVTKERWIKQDFEFLRTLPAEKLIVLFTPAVLPGIPVPTFDKKGKPILLKKDPFEDLGRAISEYHPGVRHMPYLTWDRFTDDHECCLGMADVAIVVVCQPPGSNPKQVLDSVADQVEFAWSTQDVIVDEEVFATVKPPLFLVQFGATTSPVWPDVSRFDNITNLTAYVPHRAGEVAACLFRDWNDFESPMLPRY